MSVPTVELSRQDLADFLEDNLSYMNAYRKELQRRLVEFFGNATVEISDVLVDKFDLPDDDSRPEVDYIMNQMVNDWSWLPDDD